VLLLSATQVAAQDRQPPLPTPQPDTSAARILPDSLALPDTTQRRPPVVRQPASSDGVDKPVAFSASDSLIILFNEEGGDQGWLLGNANVTYGDVKLEAYRIDILFDEDELRATGPPSDTATVGIPRFQQQEEAFTGHNFAYNLSTERGRVVGARTALDDGFIQADVAKMTEDSTLYVLDGSYTTCDCLPTETPSYSLRSRRMKVVNQQWIYTGPIQLYIYDIPTPFWLPFGFLPAQEGRRSGILPPEYGEDQRGFYLRNWGYYWAINDYLDLQVRAGLWTKGSYQLTPTFRYNRRDFYSGQLTLDYQRERSGERDDPDVQIRTNTSLRWSHNQTLNPTSRITGNVNLVSNESYLRRVSENYNDNVTQTVSSSVQYNKRWPNGGRSLSLNLRQNQLLATGDVDLTLPELSFSQSSRTPFKREQRLPGSDERWYERLTVSYSGRMSNRYSFDPLPEDTLIARGASDIAWYEALIDPSKYQLATGDETPFTATATHSVPISAPFNINRLPLLNIPFRLNVSPNASYNEDWFIETDRQHADSTGRRITEAEAGFFALRQFSTGVSANTTFYGIFPVGIGPYQGVRHTVRPTASFTYNPDFRSESWGYTRVLRDENGEAVVDTTTGEVQRYPIVSSVRSEQQTVSFSLSNIFETKRVETDSTGEQQSRTVKLFNVDLRSSYNFAADSLKLSPISLSARTTILSKLNLNFSSTFSPYDFNPETRRQLNRFLFSAQDFRFLRYTQLRLSGDFALRGGQQGASRPSSFSATPTTPTTFDPTGSSLGITDPYGDRYDPTNRQITDFAIPWSLNVNFTYSLSRPFDTLTRTMTVNTRFDFSLTPNWRVSGQSGYDFERKEIVTTSLNLFRDFECWEMAFRWIPFGQFQSWGFDLHVKSGKLRDFLRIQQPKSERDRGFGL